MLFWCIRNLNIIEIGEVRKVYQIEGSFLNDFLVTCFCCPCAGVQLRGETVLRSNN